ncbi:MAG: hypothetical protein IPM24_00245 [Bryobacterales bacterium]|nr:hypothetical protein [Bryobacterales bacterium]
MRILAASLAVLLTVAIPSSATTLARATLEELAQTSTHVVRGRVMTTHARLSGGVVSTAVTIQVSDRWKGPAGSSLTFALPGGRLGTLRQRAAGTPELVQGAEYIFFVWTSPKGNNQLLGLSQGVLEILTDSKGDTAVSRPLIAAELVDRVSGARVQDEGVSLTIEEFSARMRRALGGSR